MSTFSHSLPSVHGKGLSLVSSRAVLQPLDSAVQNDGLGCMRGLAFAMLLNLLFWLIILAGWEVWHHLR